MRRCRQIAAVALLASTLVGGAWLYLYRVSSVATFVDRRGYTINPPYTVSVQPWWSVFAAVLVIALGTLAAIAVLPGHASARSRIDRLVSPPSAPTGPKLATLRGAIGMALIGGQTFLRLAAMVTARAAHSLRVTSPHR